MTKHNEDIVREVLDTLYEANGAILGLTALDTELEMQTKIRQNECATTRRIDRAISAIQQLEPINPWHKASEELPDCLTKVFVRYSNGEVSATYRTNHFIGETPDVKVTHWMEIPKIKED